MVTELQTENADNITRTVTIQLNAVVAPGEIPQLNFGPAMTTKLLAQQMTPTAEHIQRTVTIQVNAVVAEAELNTKP